MLAEYLCQAGHVRFVHRFVHLRPWLGSCSVSKRQRLSSLHQDEKSGTSRQDGMLVHVLGTFPVPRSMF